MSASDIQLVAGCLAYGSGTALATVNWPPSARRFIAGWVVIAIGMALIITSY